MTQPKPRYRASVDGSPPQMVHDGLQNLVSGMGTGNDKRSHNRFTYGLTNLNWLEIEAAYAENWIAEQIVNVPVDDALREWRQFPMDDESKIATEEERLSLRYQYKLARYWARLYGGAGILMITDQPLNKPLEPERVKEGSLKKLVVLDRWDLQQHEVNYTDPLADDYLLPRWYTVTGGRTMIHSSHVVRVEGKELPRRLRALNGGWGDSVLRRVMEDLRDVSGTKNGIATMILESNVDVISREGLSDELSTGQEHEIMKRYALAGQMKSLVNQLLLDGSETYERKQITFSGLGEIMDRFMTWISGAADIPATRLFGQAPQGENATGEGDLNNYYDSVHSMREGDMRRDLQKLDRVLVRSALGDMPEEYEFTWPPLYQESGTELAQQKLANAQADQLYLDMGAIETSHVAQRLQSEGTFNLEDEDIEQMQEDERLMRERGEVGPGEDPSDPGQTESEPEPGSEGEEPDGEPEE